VPKLPSYGGKPGVITAIPDIKAFRVLENYDFVILGSDGIYDIMSNKDIVRCVITTMNKYKGNVHEICAASVEHIIYNALIKKTTDNVSVVMIAFKHFKKVIERKVCVESTEACINKSVNVEKDGYKR